MKKALRLAAFATATKILNPSTRSMAIFGFILATCEMGGANIQPLGLVATAILAAVLVSTSGQLEVGGCAFFVGISAVLKKPYLLELYYLLPGAALQALVRRGASVPRAGAQLGLPVRLNVRPKG